MKKTLLPKWIFLFIGLIFGMIALIFVLKYQIKNTQETAFHEHADFAFFINGERFDFSQFKYMSLEPCTVEESGLISTAYAHGSEFDSEDLKAAVHLHNGNGGTIHVHRAGVTYEDFFQSLGMEFHDSAFKDDEGKLFEAGNGKEFRFILNGEGVDSLEATPIRDLDRVLISYGDSGRSQEELLQEYGYVTNKACIYSEACSHRPPAEPESCAEEPQPFLLRMIGL